MTPPTSSEELKERLRDLERSKSIANVTNRQLMASRIDPSMGVEAGESENG